MRARIASVALAAALLLSGCSAAASEGPTIVVTTNILGDVVTEIAGDAANVTVLMRPDADPHSFAVSAQEAALMASADLLVSNGLGLEEGLAAHLDAAISDGAPHLAVGETIDPLVYDYEGSTGIRDPHFWTDPQRMIVAVDELTAAISAIDGIDAATVETNAAAYRAELETLDAELTDAFAAIPAERRNLVTNHHVFGYLAERYDFTVIGAIVPSGTTLAAPSASDLAGLAGAITSAGVGAIFADSSQPDKLAQVLASEAGLEVRVIPLFTESLTAAGGGAETYLAMMRANAERIADGLG